MGRAGGLYGQSRWSVWAEPVVCMDGDDGLYEWRCCPGSQQKPTGSDLAELDHGLHGGEGGRVLQFRRDSELPAQDHFCVAVEGRSTLAAHHLLGLQEIQAHLQALPAFPGRPNHAATGLIRRQTNHKAVEIDRRERDGRFQLLYLG